MYNTQKAHKTVSEKRTQFAISIRRNQRTELLKQLRKKYFRAFRITKVSTFIESFDLKEHQMFSQQEVQNNKEFILLDILLAKRQNLTRITFKKNQMMDEKLQQPKDTSFQIQQVELPKQYPFDLQENLYDNIAQDIYSNQGKYKKMNKNYQLKVIEFFIAFLKRNKYSETSREKSYHQALINFLQLFVLQIESPNLRQKILHWVRGTESLTLIFNSLSGQFMNYNMYCSLYDVILKGLKHKKILTKFKAVDVLLKCTKSSDLDGINEILSNNSKIFTQLLAVFQEQSINSQIYQNMEYMEGLKKASFCVCILMETFDTNILNCLKQGAGYVGAKLVTEKDAGLIESGLMILQHIANISQKDQAKQALNYLIFDRSIRETGVWIRIGHTYQIVRHQSIQVRRQFISFIANFFAHGTYDEIAELGHLCFYEKGQNLVDIIIIIFQENEDPTILQNALLSLESLLYYADADSYYDGQIQLQQKQQKREEGTSDTRRQNVIVQKILQSGIRKKMLKITDSASNGTNGYPQKIVEIVQKFLESLDPFNSAQNLSKNKMTEI